MKEKRIREKVVLSLSLYLFLYLPVHFQAFNNFYNYLRDTTLSEEQCGECSYQQSCGRQCHRKGDVSIINPLFVAERKCMGVDQSKACVSKFAPDCKLWPNKNIQLPNVTESMQQIVDGLDYLTCVPEHRYVPLSVPKVPIVAQHFETVSPSQQVIFHSFARRSPATNCQHTKEYCNFRCEIGFFVV